MRLMSRCSLLAGLLIASFIFSGEVLAEDAWVIEPQQALRWPDAELVSLTLEAADQVVVVYRLESLTRVRKGADYGWVPDTALAAVNPKGEEPTVQEPWSLDTPPTLDLSDLKASPAGEAEPEPSAP